MYFVGMIPNELIPVTELRKSVRRLGLTQASIATSIGRDQGQVSRLLNATSTPSTKTYRQICALVRGMEPDSDSTAQQVLGEAINRCWDGSMEHAISLARILDALASYHSPAQRS